MKIARVSCEKGVFYAELKGDKALLLAGEPYEEIVYTGEERELSSVKLLAPACPTKVVCIGKNYLDHINELKDVTGDRPEKPLFFIKPTTALNDPEGEVVYPSVSNRVDYEAELAVVIKKTAKHIKREDVKDYILGYTCLNDITARDIQIADGQWTRGKSMDGFCPFGPWIETEMDYKNVEVTARLNGEVKQHSNTDLMIFPVDELLAFITTGMTLLPGDVVATGTPAGVGPMQVGDVVEVEVSGVGVLKNTIVSE